MKYIYSLLFVLVGIVSYAQETCCCINIVGSTSSATGCSGLTIEAPVVVNETCGSSNSSDGSITWNVSGGQPPYSYNPSQNISGLSAGSYGVTITDQNNCSVTMIQSISDLNSCTGCPTINVTSVATNVTCASTPTDDGTIQWSASGGQGPYTYSLPLFQSGLSVGSYTMTVTDDNGCTGSRTVSIIDENNCNTTCTFNSASTVLVDRNPDCDTQCNGFITLSAVSGQSYLWSNGSTSRQSGQDLCSGTHSVTITNSAGCIDVRSYNLVADGVTCGDIFFSGTSTADLDCDSLKFSFTVQNICDFEYEIRDSNGSLITGGTSTVSNVEQTVKLDPICGEWSDYFVSGVNPFEIRVKDIDCPSWVTDQVALDQNKQSCVYGKLLLEGDPNCFMSAAEYCSSGIGGIPVILWRKSPCTNNWEVWSTGVSATLSGMTIPHPDLPQEFKDCHSSNSGANAFFFCNVPCGEYFLSAEINLNTFTPVPPCPAPTGTPSFLDYDNDGSNDANDPNPNRNTTPTFIITGNGLFYDYSFGFTN